MFATLLLTLFAVLQSANPRVTVTVSQREGPKNVQLHYTVTGPYEGRVCLDVDTVEKEHTAVLCADASVSAPAGKTVTIDDVVHGPSGDWMLTPALPDTPGDEPVVYGTPQTVHINGSGGPGISASL